MTSEDKETSPIPASDPVNQAIMSRPRRNRRRGILGNLAARVASFSSQVAWLQRDGASIEPRQSRMSCPSSAKNTRPGRRG